MRSTIQLTRSEMLLFLREPAAVFFTLLLPVVFLFLFGSIYAHNSQFGSGGVVNALIPSLCGLIVATSGVMTISIHVAAFRERRYFRLLATTPVSPVTVIYAFVAVLVLVTLAGCGLLLIVGAVVYHVALTLNTLSFAAGLLVSCALMFPLGFLLASLFPSVRVGQAVANMVFFPFVFLSGAVMPRELMPPGLRRLSVGVPLSHVVSFLRDVWIGRNWSNHLGDLAVLGAVAVIAVAVASRMFRLET